MATNLHTADAPVAAATSRVANVALWTLQVLAAAMFLMAGGSKLAGAPDMVGVFDTVGIGQWFRYLTGALEVVGAVLLLVPGVALWGALLLAAVMVGAILSHLTVLGGSVVTPLVLLLVLLVIGWGRRGQLARVLARTRR